MIPDIFFDRNPDAIRNIETKNFDRVFGQLLYLIFDIGLKNTGGAAVICDRSYITMCRELGVPDLINRTGGLYSMSTLSSIECCKIIIQDKSRITFKDTSNHSHIRIQISICEIILKNIQNSFRKRNKENYSQEFFPELNERLKRLNFPFRFHAGIFQNANDDLSENQTQTPFWTITNSETWKSVDLEMKDAIYARDNSAPSPAFHAMKALESTIKIISDKYKWTRGNEIGVSQYIDNLQSKKNGRFIESWEAGLLKDLFKNVRNPMGHGKGSQNIEALTPSQTDWAIEQSMSWIKCLVRRVE